MPNDPSISIADVHAEIVRRLAEHHTISGEGFTAVQIADGPGQLNDAEGVRLAILPPQHQHDPRPSARSQAVERTRQLVESDGSGTLVHRNAVVALAADHDLYPALEAAVGDLLSVRAQLDHAGDQVGLAGEQVREIEARHARAEAGVVDRLLATYVWVLVPDQAGESAPLTVRATRMDGGSGDLVERAATALRAGGDLVLEREVRAIRADLDGPLSTAWRDGHLSVGELWQLYTTLPYLPRLRDRSVLEMALRAAVDTELDWQYTGFALADGYDEATGSYAGLRLPGHGDHPGTIVASTLVVRPDRAVEQYHGELARQAVVTDDAGRPKPLIPAQPLPQVPTEVANG